MLLSDHYRSGDELTALAASIARGDAPQVDPSELEQLVAVVRAEPKLHWGCTVVVWIPIVVLVLLLLVVGWLFWAGAYR